MSTKIFTTAAAALALSLGAQTAQAGEYAAMECGELWYARNAIYADHGFCFKTARARSVFGSYCTTSRVSLSRRENRIVAEIKRHERNHGCAASY